MRSALVLKAFLFASLVLGLAACSSTDEKNEPADLVSFREELDLNKRWSRDVGDVSDSRWHTLAPALLNNRLYSVDLDGDVMAIDAANGDKLWSVDVDVKVSGAIGAGQSLLAFGSYDGELIALSAQDGSEKWRVQLAGEVMSAPVLTSAWVVVQTIDGKLLGLRADTGEQAWVYEIDLPVLTLRGTGAPVHVAGVVYAAFANGRIAAIDIATGIPRWEERVALPTGRTELERMIDIDGGLLVVGDVVYAASYQGNISAFARGNGRPLWSKKISSYRRLLAANNLLFAVTANDTVMAFEAYSGLVKWQNDQLSLRGLTGAQALGNNVAVADRKGYMHVLSMEDGRFMSRTRIDRAGVQVALAGDAGTVYVLADSGDLVAVEIESE